MEAGAEDKDRRDDDRRLTAEAREGVLGSEHAGEVECQDDQDRDDIIAQPLGEQEPKRDDQDREQTDLLHCKAGEHAEVSSSRFVHPHTSSRDGRARG